LNWGHNGQMGKNGAQHGEHGEDKSNNQNRVCLGSQEHMRSGDKRKKNGQKLKKRVKYPKKVTTYYAPGIGKSLHQGFFQKARSGVPEGI